MAPQRLIADTHAILWWLSDDCRLSANAKALISDSNTAVYLSAASAWEISVKAKLGKLIIPKSSESLIADLLNVERFIPLPISLLHALRTGELPPIHRDPFDRMLICQSMVEQIPLLTNDPAILQYGLQTIW